MMDQMDQEEGEVLLFSQEYSSSDDVKKVSLVIEMLKSKSQPIRMFCAKKITDY